VRFSERNHERLTELATDRGVSKNDMVNVLVASAAVAQLAGELTAGALADEKET
jgi:hypothetical protein